ncbi:MAG TPA: serine/threonine protein phosphatase [Thermoprotei archaeon]|nr:serine/threonine protein phosphatase [Thermoprotei archaeon]
MSLNRVRNFIDIFLGDRFNLNLYSDEFILFMDDIVNKNLRDETLVRRKWDGEILFIGDLHGDYYSLEQVAKIIREKEYLTIFLGDYVDRGEYSLETLMGAILLKYFYKDRVILLRGNHEDININTYYGFATDLINRYGKYWKNIYNIVFKKIYLKLSIAVEIETDGGKIFAVHGGIPNPIPSIKDIEKLPREDPIKNPILLQLLWNDPLENIDEYMPSDRGEGIYYFGKEIFNKFVEENNYKIFIRAHQAVENGYKEIFNKKLYSIFTCRYYKIQPTILEVNQKLETNPIKLK